MIIIKKRQDKVFTINVDRLKKKGLNINTITDYAYYIVDNIDIDKIDNKRINITL